MRASPLMMPDVSTVLPAPSPGRILKHPRLKHYHRPVVLAMVNLIWLFYGTAAGNWWTSEGSDLRVLALMAQTNLAAAVVFRQPYILNALAWLVTRPGPDISCDIGRFVTSKAAGTRATAAVRVAVARLRTPSGQVHPLTGAATRIGRLADNDVVLDDTEVSRQHAVVSDTGRSFIITDLRSANGVYVQGRRVRGSVALTDGDRIRICDHELVFELESETDYAVGRQKP